MRGQKTVHASNLARLALPLSRATSGNTKLLIQVQLHPSTATITVLKAVPRTTRQTRHLEGVMHPLNQVIAALTGYEIPDAQLYSLYCIELTLHLGQEPRQYTEHPSWQCYIDIDVCQINQTTCETKGIIGSYASPSCRTRGHAHSQLFDAYYSYETCGELDTYKSSKSIPGRVMQASVTDAFPFAFHDDSNVDTSGWSGALPELLHQALMVGEPGVLNITGKW